MSKAGYSIVTGGGVALAASTTKTVLGVKSNAAFGLELVKVYWGFDGVSATDAPVTCEVCRCTWGGSPPGTASTDITSTNIAQVYGRPITHGITAAKTWTTEPTALTPLIEIPLTPNGGLLPLDQILGQTPDCDVSQGFALRFNAAAAVNVRATMWVERT